MVHFIVERFVDDWAVVQDHICILHVSAVKEAQRVLHPVHIISVWVVLVRMGAAGFLASLRGHHLLACLVDEVLKLKGLDEVCVPDEAAVFDANFLVLLHDLRNLLCALLQIFGIAVHWCKALHGDLEFPAQICSGNRPFAVADLIEP